MIFFLFGGTNDSWANSPEGDLKYEDWSKDDLYFVLSAFCYLLNQILTKVKPKELYVIINSELKLSIEEKIGIDCEAVPP